MHDSPRGLTDQDCCNIWSQIPRMSYAWTIGPKAKSTLAALLHLPPASARLDLICHPDSARLLRDSLGLLLRDPDSGDRIKAAGWIIADWGGIRRGTTDEAVWLDLLHDFAPATVAQFIASAGTRRIASWSKLLSFADPSRYAIYDARTAFTLNAAMHLAGLRPTFFRPAGRNRAIESRANDLTRTYGNGSAGYDAYLALLSRFVGLGLAHDILQAEQALFAAAPAIAGTMAPPLDDAAFLDLDADRKQQVMDLLHDTLGGLNLRTQSFIDRRLDWIAREVGLDLTPRLRAAMLDALRTKPQ